MVNPNNNPGEINKSLRIYELYPAPGLSEMTEYDDDGRTEAYLRGESTTTRISMELNAKGELNVTVDPTEGNFTGQTLEKATEFIINATGEPRSVEVSLGKGANAPTGLSDPN